MRGHCVDNRTSGHLITIAKVYAKVCELLATFIMPRKPISITNEHPYHIIGRSNNRDWFDLPLNYCYEVFTNVLTKVKQNYNFKLHAFVLMNNHYHMILSTPEKNLSQGMRYFMTETSRGIRVKSMRINHIYGGRYRPCLITSSINGQQYLRT